MSIQLPPTPSGRVCYTRTLSWQNKQADPERKRIFTIHATIRSVIDAPESLSAGKLHACVHILQYSLAQKLQCN